MTLTPLSPDEIAFSECQEAECIYGRRNQKYFLSSTENSLFYICSSNNYIALVIVCYLECVKI